MEEEIKRLSQRIDKLENIYEVINKLSVSVEKLAIETKYLREDQNRLANRVDSLESKPEKRYDSAITAVITSVVGAIIGAIMALIIKK